MSTGSIGEKPPVVSVVTPAYNQAVFLRETVESVLSQDYPHIEYLVLDDGSTDETRSILEKYNGQVKWESHTNMGQTSTINKGWKMLTGDILTWLNSDDTFLPGTVSRVVDYLLNNPSARIVFGDTLFTEADGTPIGPSRPLPAFSYEDFVVNCENPIAQPSAFIRREVLEDTGMLDPYYYYFMDWDFWLRAGMKNKIDYIPESLSTYRLHSNSKTVAQARKAAPELERIYGNFFARDDLPENISRLEKKAMANMYFTSGGYYLKGGDEKSAKRMAWSALKTYPRMVLAPRQLHKFIYCLFGGTRGYNKARDAFHCLTRYT
jgi:glycosyltransferase involved in cell wall biosynthesis